MQKEECLAGQLSFVEFERCGSGVRTKAKHVWMSASTAPDLTDHLFVQLNANLC